MNETAHAVDRLEIIEVILNAIIHSASPHSVWSSDAQTKLAFEIGDAVIRAYEVREIRK